MQTVWDEGGSLTTRTIGTGAGHPERRPRRFHALRVKQLRGAFVRGKGERRRARTCVAIRRAEPIAKLEDPSLNPAVRWSRLGGVATLAWP